MKATATNPAVTLGSWKLVVVFGVIMALTIVAAMNARPGKQTCREVNHLAVNPSVVTYQSKEADGTCP